MECFDRDQDSKRLWRHFENGRNVLMLAPRRIGKTVLLNRLKDESEARGFHAVVLDVQGYREEKAFFQQLCAAIQEEIGAGRSIVAELTNRLAQAVHNVDGQTDWRTLLLNTDWKIFAEHLLTQLESGKDNRRWLILVDEIPIFAKDLLDSEGPAKVHDFLYTLRNLQLKHRTVLWLYTGSIGLDTIARRNGIEGALVDMEVESLEPFSPETAADFLAHIARKNHRTFRLEAIGAILERLGWLSPYYLEKMAETACDKALPEQPISTEIAHRAADSLLDLSKRTYWATWREHLDKNFQEPERTHLFSILGCIAQTPAGATVDTLLSMLNKGGAVVSASDLHGLLHTLEADGYLSTDATRSRFCFRMNLLREWWLRYVAPPSTTTEAAHG